MIRTVRDTVSAASRSRRIDPRLYWLIGDAVIRFLERVDDLGFYLILQDDTLARDTGIAKSSLGKIIYFRRRFLRLSMVDATIPWTNYADNKIPVPG